MILLRQNTATARQIGPYVSSTDGHTPSTGLSPTIELAKTTGAFAARGSTGAITYDSDGWYLVPFSTVDTNTLGPLIARGTESGAIPVWHEFQVVTQEFYDQVCGTGNAVNLTTGNIDSALTAYAAATTAEVDAAIAAYAPATQSSLNTLAALVATTADVDAALATLNDISTADVDNSLAYMTDTLTRSEPGQAAPSASAPLGVKVDYLFKAWRNRTDQTTGNYLLYADDAVTVDQKATVSDDGTTFTRGEVGSGP